MSRRAGFTLIEMMVALLISAVTVVVAAKIAETVIRNNTTSRDRTDLASRGRVLSGQIRADLRVAGIGSTGAVAVDSGRNPMSQIFFAVPPSGFFAIPVVRVLNNVGAVNIGGVAVQPGTDILQILVPNPATNQLITLDMAPGATAFNVATPALFSGPDCPGVYVVDQSGATQGRTQYMLLTAQNTFADTLQFPIPIGAQAMCARLTTYWIEAPAPGQPPWLRRSVATTGPGQVVGPNVWASTGADDRLAPGVMDLQVAVAFSSEIYLGGGNNNLLTHWAYCTGCTAAPATPEAWAEARVLRVSLLARTTHSNAQSPTTTFVGAREDGAVPVLAANANHSYEWITTAESLVNLRFFDTGAESGVPASPY